MKNIVFDLGGVLFARDKNKSTQEFHEFFQLHPLGADAPFLGGVRPGRIDARRGDRHARPDDRLPARKVRTFSAAVDRHAGTRRADRTARRRPEGRRGTGFTCFRTCRASSSPSCAVFPSTGFSTARWSPARRGTVKPEPRIYEIPAGTLRTRSCRNPLFIDDRAANIAAAEGLGIAGYLFDHRNPAAACGELRRRLL